MVIHFFTVVYLLWAFTQVGMKQDSVSIAHIVISCIYCYKLHEKVQLLTGCYFVRILFDAVY